MRIFAGLGNPGAKYALHRHNVGFMAIDAIADMHGFGPWTKSFQGLVSAGRLGGEKLILLKPQTFMNESGQSIGAAMRFYKSPAADVTVLYDELDLAPFKVKVKTGGGAAGHNGIRSTIRHIGAAFQRVRLGIGHPGHRDRVTGHVLGNFAKAEMDDLAAMLGAVAAEAHWLAEGDPARFMSDVALRMRG
ncbi:MAG: aminoacyl-tRNA hydrolase [Pseudomonadota bacterium]